MNELPPWPKPEEIAELFRDIAHEVPEDELDMEWPVPGLIHPGLTCALGQPERGKTTLLITLCEALLSGSEWLGVPTTFSSRKRILFLCEDRTSVSRVKQALGDSLDRVRPLCLDRWGSGAEIAKAIKGTAAGLVIIDSVYPAVGDVNDQARADAFLSAIRDVPAPVVVVHHEAKDGSSGTPAGVQRFGAAYRHTLRVRKCAPRGDSEMELEILVSGNDVPGRTSRRVLIDRDSLLTKSVDQSTESTRRKATRPSARERAAILASRAREHGLRSGMTASQYATALLGGGEGREDPEQVAEVASLLCGSAKHQSVAKTIRGSFDEFLRQLDDG